MINTCPLWSAYARHFPPPSRERSRPPSRFEWGSHPGAGKGALALGGALQGRKILELGCGSGQNAAHLAACHGAVVTAVDLIDLQVRYACDQYGHLPGLHYLTCDALRYLRTGGEMFDVIYSVFGAVGLIEPGQLLTAISGRIRRYGLLAFSVPHPLRTGAPLWKGPQPRNSHLRFPNGSRRPVPRWELDGPGWARVVTRAGMRVTAVEDLRDPLSGRLSGLMLTARRT
ncbi:class I SAM-dependent methyltransferase [Kitasatospora sp. NPDC056076]|uniref:class I SAM-dependent methyltransferase n=1 Tax=Kitasatospora sp. NPDC056076 TaxID=3345703 RepID=UPI0035DA8249